MTRHQTPRWIRPLLIALALAAILTLAAILHGPRDGHPPTARTRPDARQPRSVSLVSATRDSSKPEPAPAASRLARLDAPVGARFRYQLDAHWRTRMQLAITDASAGMRWTMNGK